MTKNTVMATIKKLSSGAFQIRVTSKLLPKPFYATFDTHEQALAYSNHLRELLDQGVVPKALAQDRGTRRQDWPISRCIAEYLRSESVPVSEIKLLDTILPTVSKLSTSHLSYDWAEAWIRQLKRDNNLAPSTIRHRHGALARCLDWMCRKHAEIVTVNPLRQLRRGFATYSEEDKKIVEAHGGTAKVDGERSRRLEPGEELRILKVLADSQEHKTFFILALESAMRMRECYTLDIGQVSLAQRTVHLDRTKNGDGRQVPLSSPIANLLQTYIKDHGRAIKLRAGRLFSFWDGDLSVYALDDTTVSVSSDFAALFRSARVEDFHFHDLRHEATCRLYERTSLSDVLIARITGHRDLRMLKRYASLRGSDLATRLW